MLANDLGNLAQRSLSMIQRYRGGQLPAWVGAEAAEQALLDLMLAALPLYHHAMEQQAFHKALETVWQVVTAANQYVDQQAPWTLHKQASPRLDGVLRMLAEVLAWLSVVLHPFMPTTMALLQDNLQLADDSRNLLALDSDQALLVDGLQLAPPLPLFPRVEVGGEEGGVAA
jgi:methionyl-tRNA synthetase